MFYQEISARVQAQGRVSSAPARHLLHAKWHPLSPYTRLNFQRTPSRCIRIYIEKTFMGIIWGNCITGWTVVILFHILSYFPVLFNAAAATPHCVGLWTASDRELPGLGSGGPPAASAQKTTHRRVLILLFFLPSGPSRLPASSCPVYSADPTIWPQIQTLSYFFIRWSPSDLSRAGHCVCKNLMDKQNSFVL